MRIALAGAGAFGIRHLDGLATVQHSDRVAFLHRFLRAPELGVRGDHAIDLLGVRPARRLQALGVMEAAQRIDHRPDHHDARDRGVEAGVACERDRCVALVAWAHGREHGQVAAARDAYHADPAGTGFQLAGARLQPAYGVIDIAQRRRIAGSRRHAPVKGRNDDAALGQRLVEHHVGRAVLVAPCTTVQINHQRERPRALWLEQAQQQRAAAVAQVFDVVDAKLMRGARRCRLAG